MSTQKRDADNEGDKAKGLVLHNCKLIDGTGSDIRPATVVIERDRIKDVVDLLFTPPSGYKVLDLEGRPLLPGLIDAHVHLNGNRDTDNRKFLFTPNGLRALRAGVDAEAILLGGFTTVRDMGSFVGIDVRNAINEGTIRGPTVIAAGKVISPVGGSEDPVYLPLKVAYGGYPHGTRLANGPDDCRLAVREQVRDGADVIKICLTGSGSCEHGSPHVPQFTPEEAKALVDEAHRHGLKVAAHCHGSVGLKTGLEAGVDSVEHGTFLDEDDAKYMAEHEIFLVPTIAGLYETLDQAKELEAPPFMVDKLQELKEGFLGSFQFALAAGVPVAIGTDCSGNPVISPGRNAMGICCMTKFGMSPMEAIVAATCNAAKLLGQDENIGTIMPGKLADLVVLERNPLDDIQALEGVHMVIKHGDIIRDW